MCAHAHMYAHAHTQIGSLPSVLSVNVSGRAHTGTGRTVLGLAAPGAEGHAELLSGRISEGDFTVTFELLNLILTSNQLLSNWEDGTKSARLMQFWPKFGNISYLRRRLVVNTRSPTGCSVARGALLA